MGHAVQDFVFTVPSFPTRPEKHRAEGFVSVGGGPAATAAVTIARLGGRALLAARVGGDPTADLIEAELRGYGVDCRHLRRFPGRASSVSAVLVDRCGERLIVNYLDPELPRAADWLPDPGALGVRAVLADLRWPEGAIQAMRAARRAGIAGILDADRPIPADREVFADASHVAFSHEALRELTGIANPPQALAHLALDAWCCVTVGAAGVHILHRGQHTHLPGHRVQVVDTLGAGDVWHGAFALAVAEGRDEETAVRFASAAAAVKVQRAGGRAGVPDRAAVERLLNSFGN